MDLVERYLAAIGRQLPPKQAADILAELRDDLLTRIESREHDLGRPLERGELEALLIEFGNPLIVAGRYRRVQHLIGPAVFPFWWAVIKLMLMIVGGVYLALILAAIVLQRTATEFMHTAPPLVPTVVFLFGIITVVFAAIEQFGGAESLQRWKPRDLPPAMGKPRSRFELAAEITWNLVFLAWWLGAFQVRDLTPYGHMLTVDLAPVWLTWKWAIVAYITAEIGADLVAIARPGWIWFNSLSLVIRYGFGIFVLSQIVQAGPWVVVGGAPPQEALDVMQVTFNLGMKIGISFTIVGMAIRVAIELWRLMRLRHAQAAALKPA